MNIQPADVAEKQELKDFLVSVNGEEYDNLAQNYIDWAFSNHFKRPSFFIAREDEKIVGAAAVSEEIFTVGVWGISWVSVDEKKRCRGIGRALIGSCLAAIKDMAGKKVSVILNTYPQKTGLYEKTGFVTMGYDSMGGNFMIRQLEYQNV